MCALRESCDWLNRYLSYLRVETEATEVCVGSVQREVQIPRREGGLTKRARQSLQETTESLCACVRAQVQIVVDHSGRPILHRHPHTSARQLGLSKLSSAPGWKGHVAGGQCVRWQRAP